MSLPTTAPTNTLLDRLKACSSAREGCWHYVDGTHHTDLSKSCWIIDPNAHHFVDVHLTINEIPDRVPVVVVRNVGKMDPRDDRQQLLDELTERCTAIRLAGGEVTARAKSSEVGGMIAIGTRITVKKGDPVDCPTVHNKVPYAVTGGEFVTGLPHKVELMSRVKLVVAISIDCFFCLWFIFPAVGETLPCIALNICPSK